MSAKKTNWNRPSDPCPICGSISTAVKDYSVDFTEPKKLSGRANRIPHNPHFTMTCEDCGHSEYKSGCPGSHKA